MGAWGTGLYQNDTSLDIKDSFIVMYNKGESVESITEKMLELNKSLIAGDEELLFWLALADTQWEHGVLLPFVKENALLWIDRINRQGTGLSLQLNKDDIEKLQSKLLSTQPQKKKIVIKRIYRCEWKVGDVFAYRLESDLAKERGLYGRYFLIRKIDEGIWYPGHIVPIVYVKLTKDSALPSNTDDYNEIEYVQTGFAKYEERFWPIDGKNPIEDIKRKSKIDYQVDEYGFLPEYRITLLNTSKRVIPSNLIYLGNFLNVEPPKIEFIPHFKINISVVFWKHFEDTFETNMLKRYCWYNLREANAYKEKMN